MSGAAFKVQGELVLDNAGFVPAAREAKAAVDGLSTAGRKLVDTSAAVSQATAREVQAQATATGARRESATAASQAAEKTAAAAAKAADAEAAAAARAEAATAKRVQKEAEAAAKAEAKAQSDAKRTQEREQADAEKAGQRAANQAARAQQAAKDAADKDSRAAVQRTTQLGYQLNDVFVQLASGQGVIRTAVQQGPQITQLYGGLGNALRAIPLAAAGYVAAIAAVVGITAAAVSQASELNARHRQTEIILQATGQAAQVSAVEIEKLVQAEARRPGAARAETQQSAQLLLSNNAITGQAVQQTLSLARDLARVSGTDLPTATAALSQGLDGTLAGARKLDAVFNVLTPAELEQIQRFEQMGEKAQAVGVVLAALERNLAGANEKGVGPLEKATTNLRSSWNALLDNLAKTGVINVVAAALNNLAQPLIITAKAIELINQYTPGGGGGGPGTAPTVEEIKAAQAELAAAQQNVKALQSKFAQSTTDTQRSLVNRELTAAEAKVRGLQANVAQLEIKAGTVGQKAEQDALKGQTTATDNLVKEAIAATDRIDTVIRSRAELIAKRTQQQLVLDSGIATPTQMAAASEAITRIDGQLRGLRTPAEELQRKLDLGETLAKIPAHLRPATEAFLETKRQALEMGKTEAEAEALAAKARANVLLESGTATQQQIKLLSEEAAAALRVADAYGTSRVQALQLAAQQKAAAAELQGSIAPGTAGEFAQRTLEENAATSIATSAEKNSAYEREIQALERLVQAEGRSSAAARETERANKVAAYAEDLRAQAAATNNATIIAAAEKQIATYDRLSKAAMQAEIRRDANALNRQFDPNIAYDQEMAKLAELQATGLLTRQTIEDFTRQAELRRLEASRSTTDGMIAGLRRYADEANNAGQAAAQGVNTGLRSIEDTIVQVATTGKFSFANMVNSMIADLVRLAVRQSITGPIASALGGINWGGLFGSSGASAAATSTGGYGVSVPSVSTGYMHAGGIVGQPTARTGVVPAAAWLGARRYHKGGLVLEADEVPIIAKRNEEVLTADNPRHRWNIGRGMGSGEAGDYGTPRFGLDIRVYTNGNGNVRAEQGTGADGMPSLDIFFDQAEQRMASKVANTTGPLYKAFAGTFGVRQVART